MIKLINSRRRLAALAASAIGLAGFAIAGVAATGAASAGTTATNAKATVMSQPPNNRRDEVCLLLATGRRDTDRDCGNRITVEVRRAATTIGIGTRGERACVAVDRERDCTDRRDNRRGISWASVSTRRGTDSVALYVDDTRLCGVASSDGDRGQRACSDRRGWLRLEADDDIDEISLWVVPDRGGRR